MSYVAATGSNDLYVPGFDPVFGFDFSFEQGKTNTKHGKQLQNTDSGQQR